ncbi:MAG: hypothetical protein JNL42_03055 [Anaerolineae bacterium]|nr:hypothetical protein [Anaerolineae bacterium]
MVQDAHEQEAVLAFVRTTMNTFAKWDVMTFFHNNPYASETARNIARFAGREEAEVARALPALVEGGLLRAQVAGYQTIYRLTDRNEARADVARFLHACEDRDFRALAIQTVIEGASQA